MLAALDSADVAAIKTGFVSQTLLAHPERPTLGTDALAEDVEVRIAHLAIWQPW